MTKRELIAFLSDPDIPDDMKILMSDTEKWDKFVYVDDITMENEDWLIECTGHPALVLWPINQENYAIDAL